MPARGPRTRDRAKSWTSNRALRVVASLREGLVLATEQLRLYRHATRSGLLHGVTATTTRECMKRTLTSLLRPGVRLSSSMPSTEDTATSTGSTDLSREPVF